MSWLNALFGRREPTSREIAKNRLQLVLVQDRVNLSPHLLQSGRVD
jgi:septum formation topological specificity factor MinE